DAIRGIREGSTHRPYLERCPWKDLEADGEASDPGRRPDGGPADGVSVLVREARATAGRLERSEIRGAGATRQQGSNGGALPGAAATGEGSAAAARADGHRRYTPLPGPGKQHRRRAEAMGAQFPRPEANGGSRRARLAGRGDRSARRPASAGALRDRTTG